MEKNSLLPNLPFIKKLSGLLCFFILLVKIKVHTKALPEVYLEVFKVVFSQCRTLSVFKNDSFEIVGILTVVHIEAAWLVNLLIVDVNFNIGENWVKNVVYTCKSRNWSLMFCSPFPNPSSPLPFAPVFFFSGIVSFVTAVLDKFLFQSQVRMSQIIVVVLIRLKFDVNAFFIEWGSGI